MKLIEAFDEFILYLQVEKNYSPNTVSSYLHDFHHFMEFLKRHNRSLELEDMSHALCRRFVQNQTLNRHTKRQISCLKSFSCFCLKEQFITKDFTAGIEPPKGDKHIPVYMKLDELQRIFRFLENDRRPSSLRNELLFKLLATSGMRCQEVVDLTWQQVDLHQQLLRVVGKGRKERLLPLHPVVIPLFVRYRERLLEHQLHDSEPVFLN